MNEMSRRNNDSGNGGAGIPEDLMEALEQIETMPGDPASSWMDRNGFVDIRHEGYRQGRGVYTHPDTPNLVYKVAVDRGNWQNKIESSIWFDGTHPSFREEVPSSIKQSLAPILYRDTRSGSAKWIAMGRAETGEVDPEEVVELLDDMASRGWGVTDFHPDNFGRIGDEIVVIDYGNLKPKRFMADNYEEQIMRGERWNP